MRQREFVGTCRTRRAILAATIMLLAAGCAGNSGRSIPSDAIDLGGGRSLIAVAPDNGTVWIYDKDTDHVVYRGRVHAGDRITVVAATDRIQIAAVELDLKNEHLNRKNRYRIYFRR